MVYGTRRTLLLGSPIFRAATMDWFKFIKKYVWDDEKTPYLVAVGKLSRKQADHEIFAYACFIAILFTVVAIIAMSTKSPYGQSYGAGFYAFSVAASAVLLALTKDAYPAAYCGIAPLAVLAWFVIKGFHPNLHLLDKLLLIALTLLWARYSWRVLTIARAYEYLPEPKQDP